LLTVNGQRRTLGTAAPDVDRGLEAAASGAAGSDQPIAARSARELFVARLRRDRVALAALSLIALLVVIAVAAPLIVRLAGVPGPNVQDRAALTSFGTPTGPSPAHPFGVDPLGRDVLARVVYGARVSLEVALVATGIAVAVGVVLGTLAGFYRGWTDTVISRAMDTLLAFPLLLLAIGIASACSFGGGCLGGLVQPGLTTVILVIAVANWPYMARIVRGQVLSLREEQFIEASRSIGSSSLRIIRRDLLPNLVAPIIVYSTLIIPINILFEAALSFLGVGVQPPDPSWGAMIADAVSIFDSAWWYMLFPGVALVLTVLAFNLVGDGLQDALDPSGGGT
jgi:peptide/nickel transport system permease protein